MPDIPLPVIKVKVLYCLGDPLSVILIDFDEAYHEGRGESSEEVGTRLSELNGLLQLVTTLFLDDLCYSD